MFDYISEAAKLQSLVRDNENSNVLEYDEAQVRQAIVHSRQDIVLIVSYIGSLNKQLIWIRWLIIIMVILMLGILIWR